MSIIAWANGSFVDPDTPVVAPSAYGLTIGQGLFETLAVYSGHIFAFTEHLDRLTASAATLGFNPIDRSGLESACREVAARFTSVPVARLRVTITAGSAGLGVLSKPVQDDITILASSQDASRLSEINSQPASLHTSTFLLNERSSVTGHKVTAYLENALALRQAVASGATEALILNTALDVSEGATANLVFDFDGELVTPALSSGCLPGITRQLCLRWAAQKGLVITEALPGQLTRDTVRNKPAALLGTLRNVQLVHRLDYQELPSSKALARLQQIFARTMNAPGNLS